MGRIAAELARLSHFSGTVRAVPEPVRSGPQRPPHDPAGAALKPFPFPALLLEMRTGPLATRGGAYGGAQDQHRLGEALAQSIAHGLAPG